MSIERRLLNLIVKKAPYAVPVVLIGVCAVVAGAVKTKRERDG